METKECQQELERLTEDCACACAELANGRVRAESRRRANVERDRWRERVSAEAINRCRQDQCSPVLLSRETKG